MEGGSDGGILFGDDGAGFLMAGGAMGAMANMVPPTPGGAVTAAQVRAQLESFKQMLDDGLIDQDDYDAVKARVLGLHAGGQDDPQ